MKTYLPILLSALAIAVIAAGGISESQAQNSNVSSLRGDTPLDDDAAAVDLPQQHVGERFTRNYRQQPPLIPHKIDKYQIDKKANQCIACHDWPQNTTVGAPKISETHYVDRDGKRLNHVSTGRWFCTQCHVPQAEAEALVENNFQSAIEVE